jgi:hypothetical protein
MPTVTWCLCLVFSIATVLHWHDIDVFGFSSAKLTCHVTRSGWPGTIDSFVSLQYSTKQSEAGNGLMLSQPQFDCIWTRRNGDDNIDQNLMLNCGYSRARLTVLSSDPLLFVSTEPILTKEECRILLDLYRNDAGPSSTVALHTRDVDPSTEEPSTAGARLLERLQQWVHHSLLGYEDDEYVVPRFVSYPDDDKDGKRIDSSNVNKENLLPDGLHVDTNGNQQFRHW